MTAMLVGFADCLWLCCVGLEGRSNAAHPILGEPRSIRTAAQQIAGLPVGWSGDRRPVGTQEGYA